MKKIIVIDDHPITKIGIQNFLSSIGYNVVATFDNGKTALEQYAAFAPDCIISDISMPGYNGIEFLEKIKEINKKIKVILYTMHKEQALYNRAMQLGADGYILKEFALDELQECLMELEKGNTWNSPHIIDALDKNNNEQTEQLNKLTKSEQRIVKLIAKGYTSKDIATELFLSEFTVENHRKNIVKKLDLPNVKNTLVIWANRNLASE
jgi:DNA-binding NarL/FixJ family response regulator